MTEELMQEAEIDDNPVDGPIDAETSPEDTESSPVEEKKVSFDEEQQKVFNEAIGSKVAKQREAERRAEELERQLAASKAAIPQPERPVIPEAPDPFDDDYSSKIRERDEAIIRQAKFDAEQEQAKSLEASRQQDQQREQLATLNRQAGLYAEKAKTVGIDQQKIVNDMTIVAQGIQNMDIQRHLLESERGPEITSFLASNFLEMDAVRGMTPMNAAVYIEKNIVPKLQASRRTTTAPAPADIPSGRGEAPKERGPKGATYE